MSDLGLSGGRKVPAWQAQTGSYSHPDYVFIFRSGDERDADGWPKTKLVHYLTPVDPVEQERLGQIRPDWAREA